MKGKTNAASGGGSIEATELIVISMTLNGAANGSMNTDKLWKAAITVTDTNTGEATSLEWKGEAIPISIPAGHTYTIKAVKLTGYAPPSMLTYTAVANYERTITLNHKTPPVGVYILMDDDSLVSPSYFDIANVDRVVGIYIRKQVYGGKFDAVVLYPEFISCKFITITAQNYSDLNYGYGGVSDWNGYEGLERTRYLYEKYTGSSYTSFAHRKAWLYTFKNGAQGWIPTAENLRFYVAYSWSDIVKAYNAIGVTIPSGVSCYTGVWNGNEEWSVNGLWSCTPTYNYDPDWDEDDYGWTYGESYDYEDNFYNDLQNGPGPNYLVSFSLY